MTSTVELAEAFGLGSTLAAIQTTLGHVQKTVDKTGDVVGDMASQVAEMRINQGRQGEQLKTLFERMDLHEVRITAVEARPQVTPTDITRRELDELKSEVASGRLSWGKVGGLIIGLGAVCTLLVFADRIIPG